MAGVDLAALCTALTAIRRCGRIGRTRVGAITADSRAVRPGTVFVCLKGARHDGHAFVPKAVRDGAVAVVAERPLRSTVPVIVVRNSRRALAELSAAFWGYPSRLLDVVGVTGTNGKTTTTYMLDSILRTAGRTSALFGTVVYRLGRVQFPHVHTTPQAPDLQRLLDHVRRRGADAAVMEVSSHALAQFRVFGTQFRVGVFTNLTRDHLDYHRTMHRYFEAKAALFDQLPPASLGGIAVINAESPAGLALARRTPARVIRYRVHPGSSADLWASHVRTSVNGTGFFLHTNTVRVKVKLKLLGAYNVANALAAAGAARGLGLDLAVIRRGLERLRLVPGRLERVALNAPFTAVVDYAHTPDALERALAAARGVARGRVITVFGCGGNRDRGKRPRMGRIATEYADHTWITSDNPRDEDPLLIIRHIVGGIRRTGRHRIEPDRRRAIYGALSQARRGDVVLVAGKGHERTQIFQGRALPFDDVHVIQAQWARTR